MVLLDYQSRGEAAARDVVQERLLPLPPVTQQQRLTALPVCKDDRKRTAAELPFKHPPFPPGRVDFTSFGVDFVRRGEGTRPGASKTLSSQLPRSSRKAFGGQEWRAEKRIRPGSKGLPDSLWQQQQVDGDKRPASKSEDFKQFVAAMMGKVPRGRGNLPRRKKKMVSSFEHELPSEEETMGLVPGKWLIDQANAALQAGARGKHSFVDNSMVSAAQPVCGEEEEEEKVLASCNPMRDDEAIDPSSRYVSHTTTVLGAHGFQQRRPALEMDGYDASALLRMTSEVFESWQDNDGLNELGPPENSSRRMQTTCSCRYICLAVCMALSAFPLTKGRKDVHKNSGCNKWVWHYSQAS